MIDLTSDESRVLGVLVEKAQTTPAQYPMTLNSLALGCNQKNNRDPLTNMSEDHVLEALDGLKSKGLAREAMLAGSRVNKFRHVAREGLGVSTAELVVLTELLLRGPQAAGELRGRAVRMMPPGDEALATLEGAQQVLDGLINRPEPLVQRLPRRPGERAERFMQLLCSNLHPIDGPMIAGGGHAAEPAGHTARMNNEAETRLAQLESQVAELRDALRRLARSAGLDDPL